MLMSKSLIGWKLHMQSSHYSMVTIGSYLPAMERVISYLGDPDAGEVTAWDLDGYLAQLRETGVSESTRQYYWKVIKSYFSWASKRKGLGIDRPDLELEMPAVPEPDVQPYTEQEVKRMLKACDKMQGASAGKRPTAERDKLIIMVLLDTGVRVSELCRIKFEDINLEEKSILIKPYETGKKSRGRTVYLGNETMNLLWKLYAENNNPANFLFSDSRSQKDNKPLNRNSIAQLLKYIGDKANVKHCGAHRFRHTFAIQYLRNGGDIYTLKRLIGHKSFYMVQRYLQLSEADSKSAHKKASPVDNWL